MVKLYEHKVRNCKELERQDQIKLPFIATVKYDGVRAFYYPGAKTLVSRQNKPIYGMDHIIEVLKQSHWPVDMELIVPGLGFNEISGAVRNHNDSPEVEAKIIDVVTDEVFEARLRALQNLFGSSHNPVSLIQGLLITSWAQYYRVYEDTVSMGYEGLVLKTLHHYYKNARTNDWVRHVPIMSEDCSILDIYEGRGKMEGMLGGFIIDFKGQECKVGTLKDIDYAKRIEIWQNPDDYIGRVIEVQFKNLQPSGKPRQPRMKGFRWDK